MAIKHILISGYYGFSNTGDEAVLSAVVGGLKEQLGDGAEIAVLSAAPEETARLHGIRAVPRVSIPEVAKALRECGLLISGGGSLIQDATSFRSLAYYLWIIALAKFYRRKVMILGQGIGPLRRSASRHLVARILNSVDSITVRDAPSEELLRELGVCRPPIRVTADPTFALEPCPPEVSLGLLAEAGIDPAENIVAVSLRRWPEAPKLEDAASKALSDLSKRLPAKLLLIAMQTPDDLMLARKVAEGIGGIAVQPGAWTPAQLLGVLGRCKLIVGMRLHALIFAASAGVPFIGISYDPKVASFLTTTSQENVTLEEAVSGHLTERVLHAWERRDALASGLSNAVTAMREAAKENIRQAVELLGVPGHGRHR